MEHSSSGSGDFSPENSSLTVTCEMHKDSLTGGRESYEILTVLTPLDDRIWKERSDAWFLTFKIFAAVYTIIFLMIGITAVVMIIKKDCIRMKVKTFLAVYMAIAILGFSRTLLLALDPYSLIGFIGDRFEEWIIVSRVFAVFGFPSLVASYTLIFLTLLKIANASVGDQWYERWRFVIPITATPYAIAIVAEIVGLTAPYPALISVIACEALFTLWGILMCIVFLFAGVRLLRTVNTHGRKTNRLSDLENSTPQERRQRVEFANQQLSRHHARIGRTTRKITIITYATALLAITYSVATATNLVALSDFIFDRCLGLMGKGDSVFWLVNHIAIRTVEIPLALVMLYSITDVSAVVNVMKVLLCHMKCCKKTSTKTSAPPLNTSPSQTSMLANSRMNSDMDLVERSQERSTETETTMMSATSLGPSIVYLLDAQSDSSTDANSVSASPIHTDKTTQTIDRADVAVQTEQHPSPVEQDQPRMKPIPKPRKKRKQPIITSTGGTCNFNRKHTV